MLTKKAFFALLDSLDFNPEVMTYKSESNNSSLWVVGSFLSPESGSRSSRSSKVCNFRSAGGAYKNSEKFEGWLSEWLNANKPVEHKDKANAVLGSGFSIDGEIVEVSTSKGEMSAFEVQCPTVVKENGDELISMHFTIHDNIKQIFETLSGECYANLINSARRDCSKKSIEKRLLREIKRQMHHYGCYDSLKNPYWGKTNKKAWARDVMLNLAVSQSQNMAFEFVKNRVFHYFGGWEFNLHQEIQKFYHAHVEYFDKIGYNLFWNSTDEYIFDLVDGEFDALFQH